MTSQMFSKLKNILGGPADDRPEQKNSGDPYTPEGFITPEEYPVAYALMKRASRLWNEVNAAGDEMGLGSTPSVPPINNLSERARSAVTVVIQLTLDNSYRELDRAQLDLDNPNIQDRAVVFGFGLYMLYTMLPLLEDEGIKVTDELTETAASLCRTMNMFVADERVVEIYTAGTKIIKKVIDTDHEKPKKLLGGIRAMTIALIHNETQRKTDDTDITEAITQLLKSLYKAFD